ncbi:MAG: response regulator [Armatimonadetes bacterium]|nr:response regulator [Armatimonadota bacterium]
MPFRMLRRGKAVPSSLALSSDIYQQVFESSSESLLITDADGTILAANPEAVALLGYPAEQMQARAIHDLMTEASRPSFAVQPEIPEGEEASSHDVEMIRLDESPLPVTLTLKPVQSRFFLVAVRKRPDPSAAEAAPPPPPVLPEHAAASPEEAMILQAVLSHIDIGICVMDREYNIVFMGGRLHEGYGSRVGTKCYDLFAYGDKDKCQHCGVRQVLERGEERYVFRHSILEDWEQGLNIGSETVPSLNEVYEVTCTPIYIRGERCVLEATRNITAQERWRQAQKMEAVWTLAAGIAHDFNNLLTGIVGYASLMRGSFAPDDPNLNRADLILQSAQQAADLTGHLMAFSRSSAILSGPVTLNDIIVETVPLLRRSVGAGIDLQVRVQPGIPAIQADATQVQNILMNLCGNARDAMPDGGALLLETRSVTLTERDCDNYPEARPGEFVQLSVTDTGSGIPPAHLARIFEPFFTTRAPGQGTGLGLANVYSTVKAMSGFIQVASVPGRTRFDIFFQALQEKAAALTNVPARPLIRQGSVTILVVDDEPIVLEFIEEALRRLDYRILSAARAPEAVELFRARHREIDLVILDMAMPQMSGPKCYAALSSISPDVKVIFSTGHDEADLPDELTALPNIGFLHKPYRIETLEAKVSEFLAR